MSSILLRRRTLQNIPRASRRLASSSSRSTVRKSKAEVPSASSADISSQKAGTVASQSQPKSRAQKASLWTPEGAPITASAGHTASSNGLSYSNTADPTPYPQDTKTTSSSTISSPSTSTTPATSAKDVPSSSDQPFPAPYHRSPSPPPPRSPITNWVLASPNRTAILLKIGDWLGYGSPKQVAARRSKVIYNVCSEVALGPERAFWYDTLSLPPSFQSWFTITNLHIWLITVRLRALPTPHGRLFVQTLIDHFFFDVEDRLRAVIGKKAPERLVTRHMKILREQWAGMGLACDHALITGDKDMASAMWRNLLGARGARGIAYPEALHAAAEPSLESEVATPSAAHGIDPSFQTPLKLEDPSSGGVTDFEGSAIDKYILYPQLMLALTAYLRRELVRLANVSDSTILGAGGGGMRESVFSRPEAGFGGPEAAMELREALRFGRVKDAAKKIDAELGRVGV